MCENEKVCVCVAIISPSNDELRLSLSDRVEKSKTRGTVGLAWKDEGLKEGERGTTKRDPQSRENGRTQEIQERAYRE